MVFETRQTNFIWTVLSWEKSIQTLYKLQKRLYKSIYVGDTKKSLLLQNLILISNCSRLLAIREVTQISLNKKLSGVDGKTSLTFIERFELNEFLKLHFNNWLPQGMKNLLSISKDGKTNNLRISTISDRAWQALIRFSIEPAHEAIFHPHNFSFRLGCSPYEIQKIFFINLNKCACGIQKRILRINLTKLLFSFDHHALIRKIIAPRSIKLGIFRSLKKGLLLGFFDNSSESYSLSYLLSNILLDGVESIHNSLRFGSDIIYFLKPFDDERIIISKLKNFLLKIGITLKEDFVELFSTLKGFNFLGWNFKVYKNRNFMSTPSYSNYQVFLKRIKHIINNSNYGALVKVNKLYPVIREWKLYHKFSCLRGPRFSLFFIKKRAFKVFNKESRQDFYSSKRLLDKCFSLVLLEDKKVLMNNDFTSCYSGHLTFWIDYSVLVIDNFYTSKDLLENKYHCIHCGMKFAGN